MTQEIINIGALPNDGEGDPLRTAFQKINNNFTQLFSTDFYTTEAYTVGNTSQVIFEVPVAEFTQGIFQINSSNPANQQSQNITLVASKQNNNANVKWTGYGTMFFGDPVTTYDMDVSGSNVRILASSIANTTVFHFISSQITFVGNTIPGLDIALDGYTANTLLAAEDGLILATET